ncbi:MBL fold metallo-hydrolase [Umboniibacter marinipuniceus]|uniref:Glyoxylase-like metal-dependent hydrolase (Beta-lactamase superfamily II) n=1 Tax=Umboniibacter marinipuniceus TaxID=569599 RepID=A0A3M0AU82_9GAMM|nr:MBL fold metallo-hydrolase [Umboniibacter marinipuniceus]RMA82512.1 glyoxylase-like metal-dependent hydrolase (beta-lactamase superfamily II) [Umboniibacter marinipuniceus]
MNKGNMLKPVVTHFFEPDSNTYSYVVQDPSSSSCAIIDSALDFDYASGSISYRGADEIIAFVRDQDLSVDWIIETHVHADHLSAAPYLKKALGGKIAIGAHITTVQNTFGAIFNEGQDFHRDGTQFDHLFSDGEQYQLGNLMATAMHTPGHTPACFTHVIGNAVFVGDTLFMPDAGTARADFPGGDAGILFDSIQKILALPDNYRVFMCHDYGPNGRELRFETTIEAERLHNIHVGEGKLKTDFVVARETRDASLAMPRLILPSLQINMRAGDLPEPETNGLVYLKIPINAFN